MSEAVEGALPEGGANVDVSSEPISTEIGSSDEGGSGNLEAEVRSEAGLQEPIDGAAADQLAEDIEQAVEDGASDKEIQDLIRSYKIKVNGQEKEIELDFSNEEDIIKRLQMAESGQLAMQRAAETERSFDEFLQDVQSNPIELLKQLGYDPVDFAEGIIKKEVEHLQKTPEQIAQEERDAELELLRQRLKEEEESRQQFEFQQLQIQAEQDLDMQITDALSATTSLPKSPYVVKRIADAMLDAFHNGYEDVQVNDVLPWVEKEINEEMSGMFSGMEDKVLEKFIGKSTADRLRKQRLNKMQTVNSIQDTGKKPVDTESAAQKKIKLNEWLKGRTSLT